MGELLDAAAFDAPGQVSAPEGDGRPARELFLAHIDQLPACYTSVSTCDAWEVELAFHGQTVGSDGPITITLWYPTAAESGGWKFP